MDAYQDLEERVKARGVRVAERLAILEKLRQFDGGEQLAETVDQFEDSIEEAARKVLQVIR